MLKGRKEPAGARRGAGRDRKGSDIKRPLPAVFGGLLPVAWERRRIAVSDTKSPTPAPAGCVRSPESLAPIEQIQAGLPRLRLA